MVKKGSIVQKYLINRPVDYTTNSVFTVSSLAEYVGVKNYKPTKSVHYDAKSDYVMDENYNKKITALKELTDEFVENYYGSHNPESWRKMREEFIRNFVALTGPELIVFGLSDYLYKALFRNFINSDSINVGQWLAVQSHCVEVFDQLHKEGMFDDYGHKKISMIFGQKINTQPKVNNEPASDEEEIFSLAESDLLHKIVKTERVEKVVEIARAYFHDYPFSGDWLEFSKKFNISCNNSNYALAQIFRRAQTCKRPQGLSRSLEYIQKDIDKNLHSVEATPITNKQGRCSYINRKFVTHVYKEPEEHDEFNEYDGYKRASNYEEVETMLDISEIEDRLGYLIDIVPGVANNYYAVIKGAQITNEMLHDFELYYCGLSHSPVVLPEERMEDPTM